MAARIVSGEVAGHDEEAVLDRIREMGLSPQAWRNDPDEGYASHSHGYDKILYCVSGSIVFHTDAGDLPLNAGDRLDLPAGARHAATVGPHGCRCVEAAVEPA